MNNIKNTSFFKYLFFDQYLTIPDGGDPKTSCTIFNLFIESFNNNTILESNHPEIYINFNKPEIFNLQISDLNSILNDDDATILDEELLLSGYYDLSIIPHSINIYWKINRKGLYNLYIINSGNGIKYHGNPIDNKYPIIIRFDNVSRNTIIKIKHHHIFCFDNTIINKSKNRNDGKSQFFYNKSSPPEIYEDSELYITVDKTSYLILPVSKFLLVISGLKLRNR